MEISTGADPVCRFRAQVVLPLSARTLGATYRISRRRNAARRPIDREYACGSLGPVRGYWRPVAGGVIGARGLAPVGSGQPPTPHIFQRRGPGAGYMARLRSLRPVSSREAQACLPVIVFISTLLQVGVSKSGRYYFGARSRPAVKIGSIRSVFYSATGPRPGFCSGRYCSFNSPDLARGLQAICLI